ncbi:MAG TPA: DMT family transporter [Mycobacterium sp.]|nr:DMT family transporter [Mycobacterium sp.]
MTKEAIAALLTLGAALCVAIGDVIQQRAAHGVTEEPVGHVRLLTALLRDRLWWSGSVAAVLGVVLQSAALGLGSVLLVEVLLVTSLLFALPMSARLDRQRVSSMTWLWAGLLAAAQAIVIVVGHPTSGLSHVSQHTWAMVILVLGPVLLGCVLGARVWPGRVAAALLAAVSASSWAVFAVLTKGVLELLSHGFGPLLRSPDLYGFVLAALLGTIFQQSAFRAGPLTASMPTFMVVEPAVATVLAVTLLGETLRPGGAGWFALVPAVLVMIAATVVVSRSEAAGVA